MTKDKSSSKDDPKDKDKDKDKDRSMRGIDTRSMSSGDSSQGPSSSDAGKHGPSSDSSYSGYSGAGDYSSKSETKTADGGTDKTTTTVKQDGTVVAATDHYDANGKFTASTTVTTTMEASRGTVTTDSVNKDANGKVASTEHDVAQRGSDGSWTDIRTETDYKDGKVTGTQTTTTTGRPDGTRTVDTVRENANGKVASTEHAVSHQDKEGSGAHQQESAAVATQEKNVITLPEITIYGVPTGSRSKSGEGFDSPDKAAAAALSEIDTKSVTEKSEFAGNIYQKGDGSYSFSPPVKGTADDSFPKDSAVPKGAQVVGTYHSHGGAFEASDEKFSPRDQVKATFGHKESYLVTPKGDMYKYTPVDHLPKDKQGEFPTGQVTRLDHPGGSWDKPAAKDERERPDRRGP
ncbi:DUF4329 domain-containing protein [Streptomyces sp. MS2.AVA.5]|uniref:DUF4329 domain-containing protein n=1 Tax=Streptomyces achmelvichensis TaxID=3134111 RepID=A0ACC6Q9E7_9ACTN